LDPLDLVEPRCSICGQKPVVESSTHWFFDLPRFSERLHAWLTSNKTLPEKVKNFSLSWIKEGLKPRAVTRDNLWGIPAPFPNSGQKTIYVWFEAVLGYLSATIEWAHRRGDPELWKKFWLEPDTRTVYFIGKDNIPFHAVILPALLMATHEPYTLPFTISATEYLTFEGRKFSKSQGVGIWLDQAIQLLDADVWRHYLVKIRPEMGDSNFSYEGLQAAVNADLNDNIGNFIHRVLTFISNYFDGLVPEPGELTPEDKAMLEEIEKTFTEVRKLFEEIRERQALECVLQLAREGNTYLNRREPWKVVKKDRAAAATILYTAAQIVKTLALLLSPFTPTTSQRILELVGEGGLQPVWSGEKPWILRAGTRLGRPKPLFEKITDEGLERLRAGVTD
jgi:methionyl-tRNA synthetase